jgi:hypothetical protein
MEPLTDTPPASINPRLLAGGVIILLVLIGVGIAIWYMVRSGTVPEAGSSESSISTTTSSHEENGQYRKDMSGLYYNDTQIEVGNVPGYVFLGSDFAMTSKNVYLLGSPVSALDPATFQILSTTTLLVKDKTAVYHVEIYSGEGGIGIGNTRANLEPVEGADSPTFKLLQSNFATDKNNVYFYIQNYGFGISKVDQADPNTFKALPGVVGFGGESGYAFFGLDSLHVYLGSRIVVGADPVTFAPIIISTSGQNSTIPQYSLYSKDKNSVYSNVEKLAGADPASFQLLTPDIWWAINLAKDKNHVYGTWNSAAAVHAPSFQVLLGSEKDPIAQENGFFAKDAHAVYWLSIADDWGGVNIETIAGADPATFAPLGTWYGKDKGPIAQLVEHLICNEGVRSSNLLGSTFNYYVRIWKSCIRSSKSSVA